MSFDEALLDDPARLARGDGHQLLWSLATAGAQVRRAVETVADFGVDRLRDDDLPRAVLVAADPGLAAVSQALAQCSALRVPAVIWHGAELPRWAGPADALLIGSLEGRHPRLAALAAQGVQRGLATAVVAPAASPVAAAAGGRAPLHELSRELDHRAARWSVLTPLLQALDSLGIALVPAGPLIEIADALDQQAEACRPDADAFINPAKSLAIEFAPSVPLIAGAGALAGVAAHAIAEALQVLAGVPAVSVSLPDGAAAAGALLRAEAGRNAGEDLDGFFRDRVDDLSMAPRPRLLVVGDDGSPEDPLLGERSELAIQLDEVAARRSAAMLREIATSAGLRASGVDVASGEPLARFASATAFGDFTAAYLALGRGVETAAPW